LLVAWLFYFFKYKSTMGHFHICCKFKCNISLTLLDMKSTLCITKSNIPPRNHLYPSATGAMWRNQVKTWKELWKYVENPREVKISISQKDIGERRLQKIL
jgi:hypothetical protein